MADTRVSSWTELQDVLYAGSWSADLQRFRSDCAFRGVADADHVLDTSLMRLGGPFDWKAIWSGTSASTP